MCKDDSQKQLDLRHVAVVHGLLPCVGVKCATTLCFITNFDSEGHFSSKVVPKYKKFMSVLGTLRHTTSPRTTHLKTSKCLKHSKTGAQDVKGSELASHPAVRVIPRQTVDHCVRRTRCKKKSLIENTMHIHARVANKKRSLSPLL